MLVSVVVAPYSWFPDQAVLLPALLHALYRNRSRSLIAIFALLSAGIEVANFRGVPLGNIALYPWTAPIWLVWYLCARGTELRGAYGSPRVAAGVTSAAENA